MRKKGWVIILLLLHTSVLYAQNWPKVYLGMNAFANGVINNYDKGFLILGTKTNYKLGWIIKTDVNGDKLWDKKIGTGQYTLLPKNIEQTYDNGYIVCGTTSQIGNQYDAFILKLNSCAEPEWCKIIYTPTIPNDLGICVKPVNNEGYLLLGMCNDQNPKNRINLFRFNSVGDLIWHKSYLPDSLVYAEDAYTLMIDYDGFIITGDAYYPNPGMPPGYGVLRPYLIKTDTSGQPLWKTVYWKGGYNSGSGFKSVANSNNYYCAARRSDTSGTDHPELIKLFHNGDTAYSVDLINNSYLGMANQIIPINDTNLIVGVAWSLNNGPGPVGLIKIDTLGNSKADITFLNSETPMAGLAKSIDNKFLSVITNYTPSAHIYAWKVNSNLQLDSNYTKSYLYDSLCPYQINSDTIELNCDIIVDVSNLIIHPETATLVVNPNPASSALTVEFPQYLNINSVNSGIPNTTTLYSWYETKLEIFNVNGVKVLQKIIPKEQQKLDLEVDNWSRGLYLFRLQYNNITVAMKKVLIY